LNTLSEGVTPNIPEYSAFRINVGVYDGNPEAKPAEESKMINFNYTLLS
jgi:hypothetical protein